MELVVDANVMFAAVIKESHTRHLLLLKGWKLYLPEFFFEEFEKHKKMLVDKTGLSEQQLAELMSQLFVFGNIQTIHLSEYADNIDGAKKVSPDINDVPYFSLALKRACAIWSNDKKLKEQKAVKVYSTQELLQLN